VTVTVAVTVSVSVSEPVRGPGSGVRHPASGVRLLQRDQVNPVTVSDTGSDAPRARPSHFHASTGGPWSIPRKRHRRDIRHGSHPARVRGRVRVRDRVRTGPAIRGPVSGVRFCPFFISLRVADPAMG